MKKLSNVPFVLALAIPFAACQGAPKAPCPDTQTVVLAIAAKHPDVVRLSVHAVPPGGGALCAIASTSPDRLGKPSDPEDGRALANGGMVVLREEGAIDVTLPMLKKDGKFTAVAGVTVKGADDKAAIATAQAVADELEAEMAKKM